MKIEIFSPTTFSGRSFMVQHLLHIQNLVTPEICYNTGHFRRLVSPLGASGSGFGIFQPPLDGVKQFISACKPL